MRSMRLLFKTPEAAREVAFMLQCKHAGFTMITLPSIHALVLRTAIELTGADFCFAGLTGGRDDVSRNGFWQ